MTTEDVELATEAISQGKTVVAEFNTAASPTSVERSSAFRQLFGTAWTGWIGRFFPDLTKLQGLEKNVVAQLKTQAKEKEFKLSGPGYVFINDSTEKAFFVNDDTPLLYKWDQNKGNAKDEVRYNYWFEILELDGGKQQAHFSWNPSKRKEVVTILPVIIRTSRISHVIIDTVVSIGSANSSSSIVRKVNRRSSGRFTPRR